jgi:hypothetical protein
MLDMLTADAAAKHGHGSDHHAHLLHLHSHSPQEGNGGFLQMPLSLLGSLLRGQTPSPAPAIPQDDARDTPLTTTTSTPAITPTPSRPASLSSLASGEDRPKRRSPKPKTTYNLAQPPPVTGPRHKLHLRPKVLLQLHQVVPGRRPKPVYEVIPFSLLAPRSTRRLARTFNSKERLCPSDLLIVKAEDYEHTHDEEKTDDERWGTREVIGIICPSKKGDKDPSDKTEVLMDDGTSWEVTNMPNGGYEFSYTDEHGLTLKRRWILKPPHSRRVSAMSNPGSPGFGPEEKKFNFSTISPYSRRHPIIAGLSKASISVQDSYTMPSATSPPTPGGFASPLPTPASITSITDIASFTDSDKLPVQTDDALRRFIVLSGIWVAFSENWSPAYSSSKAAVCPYPLHTSGTSRPTPNRAVSMSFLDSPRSVSPASTIDDNHRPKLKLFRSSTHKSNGSPSPSFPAPISSPTSPTVTPSTRPSTATPPIIKTRGRRANSTGNADLGPRTSTRKTRFDFEDQTLAETEEERQSKRSMELLRIKTELTTPITPALPSAPAQILIPPPAESACLSPPSPDHRSRKTQSAYNPVTTAGLWDSGVVVDGPGLKSRPTSLVIGKEKQEKAKVKSQRRGFRKRLIEMFRREKS